MLLCQHKYSETCREQTHPTLNLHVRTWHVDKLIASNRDMTLTKTTAFFTIFSTSHVSLAKWQTWIPGSCCIAASIKWIIVSLRKGHSPSGSARCGKNNCNYNWRKKKQHSKWSLETHPHPQQPEHWKLYYKSYQQRDYYISHPLIPVTRAPPPSSWDTDFFEMGNEESWAIRESLAPLRTKEQVFPPRSRTQRTPLRKEAVLVPQDDDSSQPAPATTTRRRRSMASRPRWYGIHSWLTGWLEFPFYVIGTDGCLKRRRMLVKKIIKVSVALFGGN